MDVTKSSASHITPQAPHAAWMTALSLFLVVFPPPRSVQYFVIVMLYKYVKKWEKVFSVFLCKEEVSLMYNKTLPIAPLHSDPRPAIEAPL